MNVNKKTNKLHRENSHHHHKIAYLNPKASSLRPNSLSWKLHAHFTKSLIRKIQLIEKERDSIELRSSKQNIKQHSCGAKDI